MKLIKLIHGIISGILPSYMIYRFLAFFLSIGKDSSSWTTGISIPLAVSLLFWLLFILYSVFKKENIRSIWKMSLIISGVLSIIVVFLLLIAKGNGGDLITTSIKVQKNIHLESSKTIVSFSFTFMKDVIVLGLYGIFALLIGYKIKH